MGWDVELMIDSYYGEYKKGFLGKKKPIKLFVYRSRIEGYGFSIYDGEIDNESRAFDIKYTDLMNIYIGTIHEEEGLFIEYKNESILGDIKRKIVLMGLKEMSKWIKLIQETKNNFLEQQEKRRQNEIQDRERIERIHREKEDNAIKYFQDCYAFHIKEDTPCFKLYENKNKIALIYIDKSNSLNFLKIDGYAQEENCGTIQYEKIHYYEKAGNVHYVSDIHGSYSSYGGSITGGEFSKLAVAGGGLLFGIMGMTAGALLSYKPKKQEPINTSFNIESDTKRIDERNIILNFYSDLKKQYIDIELPQDIYNFLQTYLPEKKYAIVSEIEKEKAIRLSNELIQGEDLLHIDAKKKPMEIETLENAYSLVEFKSKVEKLKILKENGMINEEEFNIQREKLLENL